MLQLALDFVDAEQAYSVARRCSPYVDILEAGTPLIKAHGMKVLDTLQDLGLPICADLKTFDAGRLEAELAASHGAQYATVLAAASDRTIKEFVSACRDHHIKSVADLMNSPIERTLFLQEVGVDLIAVHSGIDEQKEGRLLFERLQHVRHIVKTPLVVAGGISAEHMGLVAGLADIIVIGSAITAAKEPALAAKKIRSAYLVTRKSTEGRVPSTAKKRC